MFERAGVAVVVARAWAALCSAPGGSLASDTESSQPDTARFYLIRLRADAGTNESYLAETNAQALAFNTLKFITLAAARAHCRRECLDPRDYVICLSEFAIPKQLQVFEIEPDEPTVTLGVAQ